MEAPKQSSPPLRPTDAFAPGNTPRVTAVMITGLHTARYVLARVAIECFKQQTYLNKELLIINHGTESLFDGDERILELRVHKREHETVGDLRNLAIRHAHGDYIINWDDDDWYHRTRIETQMAAALQKPDAAVMFKNRLHYSFENNCAFYHNVPHGASATILHPRSTPLRHPSLVVGSDGRFAERFTNRVLLDNDPALYIRFYHGLNLRDAGHVMGRLAEAGRKNEMRISAEHQRVLHEVLRFYSAWKPLRSGSAP